jgi:CHASE2 domain-containing sensor protein
MKPGDPEYEAKMAADIARLNAAKGFQVRAWFRENKAFALVIVGYVVFVSLCIGLAMARGISPGAGAIAGVVVFPLLALRMYARFRRSRR